MTLSFKHMLVNMCYCKNCFGKITVNQVPGVTYFARDPLRSYFDERKKNEIYLKFLNLGVVMYATAYNVMQCIQVIYIFNLLEDDRFVTLSDTMSYDI